ncbi:hypothetical protein F4810DRAFT_52419 [Camillea tinctor]|nr:hypothetical protein F4810DRAFT_52419 [Camillea tinctor]
MDGLLFMLGTGTELDSNHKSGHHIARPNYPLNISTPSSPTPSLDHNSSSSPTDTCEVHFEAQISPQCSAHKHKAVLSPTLQEKLSNSLLKDGSQDLDINAAADSLLSLQYASWGADRSPYKSSTKQSPTSQAYKGSVGHQTHSVRSYFSSLPDSSLRHNSPSPNKEHSYDSDETVTQDEKSSKSTVRFHSKQHQQRRFQPYKELTPTRRSIRIHINQEAKNLESNMCSDNNNKDNNTSQASKSKSKDDAAWNASKEQALREQALRNLEAMAGGPAKSDSKEDEADYLNRITEAWLTRQAQKPWPQLEQGQKFIKNMSKDLFEYPRQSRETKETSHTHTGTVSEAMLRSQPNRDVPPLAKPRAKKTSRSAGSKANATGKRKPSPKKSGVSSPEEGPFSQTAAEPGDGDGEAGTAAVPSQQADATPAKKKRRTSADNLASDLGEKWKAHVDEHGHRPTRNAAKKP